MYLVVGLGNPGIEYEGTRHNIGFAVVDALASQYHLKFRRGVGEFSSTVLKSPVNSILFMKPLTYMNRSGNAVRTIMKQHNIEVHNLVVILDDFHLPLGALRLRQKGSAGGHNGLASVIEQLGTNEFNRIRCGIASAAMPDDKEKITNFVLGHFRKSEQAEVQAMIKHAGDAVLQIVDEGFEQAMNKYNSKVSTISKAIS